MRTDIVDYVDFIRKVALFLPCLKFSVSITIFPLFKVKHLVQLIDRKSIGKYFDN